MTKYAVERYTVAEFKALTVPTETTFLAVSYRKGCASMVFYITPDPRNAA